MTAWCGRWCWRLTIAVVAMASFLFGTFAADREIPYVRHSGYIVPANPKPGDRISIQWDADVRRICPGWITRRWKDQDGDVFDLASSPARYIDRADQTLSTVMVPRSATCGPDNEYTADAEYWCNWTHRFWPLRTSKSIRVNVSCAPPADIR